MAGKHNGDIFPVENLAQFQINTMTKHADLIALVDANTNKHYSYATVIDRIQRLAAGLKTFGLRKGDVLCALTFNTIEYPIIWYAVNLLGATFQTASPLYTDEELERRFKECSTKFLVTAQGMTSRVSSIIKKLKHQSGSKPSLSTVIVIGDADGYVPYSSLFTEDKVTTCADNDPRTTAAILLSSSGTTGLPKFVQLSHVNIIANMIQLKDTTKMTTGMCTILTLPVFHHFGVHASMGTGLYIGLKLVVMERFDEQQFLSLLQLHKAQFLQMVPTMAARLVKFPDRSKFDISSVQFIQTGGAPLGVGLEKQLCEMFELKFIGQAYGSTEGSHTAGNMTDKHKAGSCGVAPCGDIGYIDDDGLLFIVDRLKELIKFRGYQVAPAHLEDILIKHPAVTDAAVVGVPDPEDGELPKAFVVKQHGALITEQEIISYMDDHVSSFERLRGGVEFIQQIPRNPSGKIIRRYLREGGN